MKRFKQALPQFVIVTTGNPHEKQGRDAAGNQLGPRYHAVFPDGQETAKFYRYATAERVAKSIVRGEA